MPTRFLVEITRTAERDLHETWDFIADDSPEIASQFVSQLEKSLTTLETFPERCPLIPEREFLGISYRHLIVQKYRVIFRIFERKVYVLRIIHGARLLDTANIENEPDTKIE